MKNEETKSTIYQQAFVHGSKDESRSETSSLSDKSRFEVEYPVKQKPFRFKIDLNELNCKQKNTSTHFCTDPSCQEQKIFCCSKEKCRCRQFHSECQFALLSLPLKNIGSKLEQMNNLQKLIDESFDDIIDRLSNQRDKIVQGIQTMWRSIFFESVEREFMGIIQAKQEDQEEELSFISKVIDFKSDKGLELWKVSKMKHDYSNIVSRIEKQISDYEQRNEDMLKKLGQTIKKTISCDHNENPEEPNDVSALNFQQPSVLLTEHQELKEKHERLIEWLRSLKSRMSYHGNYLNQYYDSKAYFHVDPKRECIAVYKQIDQFDLNVYV